MAAAAVSFICPSPPGPSNSELEPMTHARVAQYLPATIRKKKEKFKIAGYERVRQTSSPAVVCVSDSMYLCVYIHHIVFYSFATTVTDLACRPSVPEKRHCSARKHPSITSHHGWLFPQQFPRSALDQRRGRQRPQQPPLLRSSEIIDSDCYLLVRSHSGSTCNRR